MINFFLILVFTFYSIKAADVEFNSHVLVCDGGGLKGIYIASVLEKMEEDLKSKRNISHTYQFFKGSITGTSTGSIIALALVCPNPPFSESYPVPYTAKEIRTFYEKMGSNVFLDGFCCHQFKCCKIKFCKFENCSMNYKCNRCEENWEDTFFCNEGRCSNILEFF